MWFVFAKILSLIFSDILLSSIQDGIYALGKPICAPPCLSEISAMLPLRWFQCLSDWLWPSLVVIRKMSSAFSFHASLLQAIDGVMSLSLCPQVVSQAPQHLRSEKQAICEGCFARQSICSVISLHMLHMREHVHVPQEFLHSSLGYPFHFSLFVASSLNLWGGWHVWFDSHLLRQSCGGHGFVSTSIIKLEVEIG